MARGCWLLIALISGLVAIAFIGVAINTSSQTEVETSEGTIPVKQESAGLAAAFFCCPALLFGALSLFSLNTINNINKEVRREKREKAMLGEVQTLRQQAGQQPRPTQPQISEDDMQIKLAGKLWKEGKKTAALEILESMPFNERAQSILNRLRTEK